MTTQAFSHYQTLRSGASKGRFAVLTADAGNDYYKEQLPTIPAGTVLQIDFAGDFGCYAIADIGGVLHKVKVQLHDLHKIALTGPEPVLQLADIIDEGDDV